jgi:hypothetical protein
MSDVKWQLVENQQSEDKQWGVLIEDGKYAGLVYGYGNVRFLEKDGDDAVLQFEYNVLEKIDIDMENLSEEDYTEFRKMIGDILVELIEDAVDYKSKQNEQVTFKSD